MPRLTPWEISPAQLTSAELLYVKHVPKELEDLGFFRKKELPAKITQRKKAGKDIYLTKGEILKLVEWKLKHGQFRPQLLVLVRQNTDRDIRNMTGNAFKTYISDRSNPHTPLKELCKLKGIGPATASLLLSVLDPDNVPFFSDELFRWLHWDDEPTGRSKARGWERKINYTAKEYASLVERLMPLRQPTREGSGKKKVPVHSFERAAYGLCKEGLDVGDELAEVPSREEIREALDKKLGNDKQEEDPSEKQATKKRKTYATTVSAPAVSKEPAKKKNTEDNRPAKRRRAFARS